MLKRTLGGVWRVSEGVWTLVSPEHPEISQRGAEVSHTLDSAVVELELLQAGAHPAQVSDGNDLRTEPVR